MTQPPPQQGVITMYPPSRRQYRPLWAWISLAAVSASTAAVALVVLTVEPDLAPVETEAVVATAHVSQSPEASEASTEPKSVETETVPSATPAPTRVVTIDATTRPPRKASSPKPTKSLYMASPAEIYAAQVAVRQAEEDYVLLQNSGGTTEIDLAVQQYEIDRLKQNLADLRAGTPGIRHRKLDIREAKVYLMQAKERFDQISADPSRSDLERQQAWADVLEWNERLQQAQSR